MYCSLHQYCFNKCYLRESKQITSKKKKKKRLGLVRWGHTEWMIYKKKAYKKVESKKTQHKPVLHSSEVRYTCSAVQQLTCPSLNLHQRLRQDNLNLLQENPCITFETFSARQPLQMSNASHHSRSLWRTPLPNATLWPWDSTERRRALKLVN